MRLMLFLYPWLELLSLIQLGIEAGALLAVAWVLGMFMLGSLMLRHVGMMAVVRLHEARRSGVLQQTLFADDFALALAGLLLMIPGLLSDFFAVVCLMTPARRFVARKLNIRQTQDFRNAASSSSGNAPSSRFEATHDGLGPVTLDGEYQERHNVETGSSASEERP